MLPQERATLSIATRMDPASVEAARDYPAPNKRRNGRHDVPGQPLKVDSFHECLSDARLRRVRRALASLSQGMHPQSESSG